MGDERLLIYFGTTLAIIIILLVTLGLAVAFVFRQQDRSRMEVNEDLKSYRGMAREALDRYQDIAERWLHERGLPLPQVLADVLPEHSSPVTGRQSAAASLATQRARLTAINRAIDAAQEQGP